MQSAFVLRSCKVLRRQELVMDASTRCPVQLAPSETWPSGRRHSPAKGAYGPKPVSRVQIPASPPMSLALVTIFRGLRGGTRIARRFREARISLTSTFRRGCLTSADARVYSQSASLVVPVLRIQPHVGLRSPLTPDLPVQETAAGRIVGTASSRVSRGALPIKTGPLST